MDLVAHERLHAYSLDKAHERSHRVWRSDLVVVVTWFERDLEMALSTFPFETGATFALMVKGTHKSCESIPAFLAPHVVLCAQLENAEGRDSHTISEFLRAHYHRLPRLMYFIQDDSKPRAEIEHIPRGNASAFGEWVAGTEADPFAKSSSCLCNINLERWTSPDENDVGGYGGLYHPMQYILETFLEWNISESGITALRWPGACSFMLSARAVRKKPRMFYTLLSELLRGGSERYNILRLCPDIRGVKFCRAAQDLAHVVERLWFAMLDDRYEQRDLRLPPL